MIWFLMAVVFVFSSLAALLSTHTWWIYLLLSLVFGTMMKKGSQAFICAAVATAMVWVMVAYYFDMRSQGLISRRMAEMFGLPSSFLIYPVIVLIAAISSGLFALSGFQIRSCIRPFAGQK